MTGNAGRGPTVLHVITRLDAGGAATNTVTSVDRLREHGYRTALAYGRTKHGSARLLSRVEDLGAPVHALPSMVREIAPVRDTIALSQLVRLMRKHAYDLVHTHTSKAGALGRVAARLCRIPTVHTPHGHILHGYFGPLKTRAFVTAERRLARRTAFLVSLTDGETEDSLAQGIGTREQYRTIHSGVPLAQYRNVPAELGRKFRCRHGIPPEHVLILSLGRLVPVKNFDGLLRAMAVLCGQRNDVHIAIGGDGPEMEALGELAARLGIAASVTFTGHLEDVRPALGAADVFVLPSRNEGMGRVIIEAMAAGVPCLATRTGGIPDVIAHDHSGLLVPPGDAEALAASLGQLCFDRALRQRLGVEGARSVYPEFDETTMIEKLADLYGEVLRATTTPS